MLALLIAGTAAYAEPDLSPYDFSIDLPGESGYEAPDAEAAEHGCIGVYCTNDTEPDVYIDAAEGDTAAGYAKLMKQQMDGDKSGITVSPISWPERMIHRLRSASSV